jgi:hypothetical protein
VDIVPKLVWNSNFLQPQNCYPSFMRAKNSMMAAKMVM